MTDSIKKDSSFKIKDDTNISPKGKAAIEIAEELMDLYLFHYKFQTKEFINYCNQVWSDE